MNTSLNLYFSLILTPGIRRGGFLPSPLMPMLGPPFLYDVFQTDDFNWAISPVVFPTYDHVTLRKIVPMHDEV
jgi:hypothetical protein